MYRYQKMLNKFLDMEEFKGYIMDITALKSFHFEKTIKETTYYIYVNDGAYYPPKLFKERKKDKRYEKIAHGETEKEVQRLYKIIEETIRCANEDYECILPGYTMSFKHQKLYVRNMVETMENYKENSFRFPEEIRIWIEYYENDVFITEIEIHLLNLSKEENTPLWRVELVKKVAIIEESLLKMYIEMIETCLNKPYRLRQIFLK